ncbi:hypothetical protein BH23GEM6_BH23GEM6_23270 [soil metagenome]
MHINGHAGRDRPGGLRGEHHRSARLSDLQLAELLAAPPEKAFDRLTRLASKLLRAPIALITVIDGDRQFIKSQCGLPEPWASARETALSHSFCRHVPGSAEPLIISDTREDHRFCENLAIRDLSVIAYAGIPLITSAGDAIGSFCVIDHEPRAWIQDEIDILVELANSVVTEIELRATAGTMNQAFAELQRREQRLELALRAGRLGAWELDLRTETLDCTAQCKANFGRSPNARFTYADLIDAIHPEDRDLVCAEIQIALEGGGRYEARYRARWPDGSVRFIAAQGIVVRDEDGRAVQMAGVTQDVTEQVRTREQLEEVSRAKSDFMAVVSHELRTPLTAVMAFSELLLMGVPEEIPSSAQDHVRRIDQAARQLLVLIEEILTYSRVQAGRESVQTDHVMLSEILDEAVAFVRPLAEKKSLTMLVEDPGPLMLRTDGSKVCQILRNLLSNAVKFMDQGQIHVTTTCDRQHLRIHVQDTGPGIAPMHLKKIFDPFWQVNQSSTRVAEGAGLGLSVSRQIAHLIGGEIGVESTLGAGSRFTLKLLLEKL